jgi:uncharacterized membrane protein YebE (DUF533 family)
MIDLKGLLNQVNQQLNNNPSLSGGLAGGLAGGLIAGLLGSKTARKMAGNALTYGGLAALGGLAYKAWQNHQQGVPANAADEIAPATPDSGFVPHADDLAAQAALGLLLLRAMIAAAKSDGQIDAAENQRIFDEINRLALSSHDKSVLLEEYARPSNLEQLVAGVATPQQASEVYAASALIIGEATLAEQQYLDDLARRLKLEPGLTQQLRALVDQTR